MLESSPLGLMTNEGDFSTGMKLTGSKDSTVTKNYSQQKIKKSQVQYSANQLTCNFENAKQRKMKIVFLVSNNDIAFRYELATMGERFSCVVEKEATGYKFPSVTTTFLSPMMAPMTGFARTAPSYESGYQADAPMASAHCTERRLCFSRIFSCGRSWLGAAL